MAECYAGRDAGEIFAFYPFRVFSLNQQSQLYQKIVYDDTLSNKQRTKIVMAFSDVDKRLVDGSDEHLTILDLTLQISGMLAET